MYCLHLATGRTMHTRSGSGPTIYRGGPGNDEGDRTRPNQGRKENSSEKKRKGEKRGRRKKDGWTMDCNLVSS
ncbi:hypothetical protein TNCV_1147631 [Trichonephila clavipes]|nr:hypothetical protein TNCV_1147631 [Trichonephila clavipes]